MSRNQVRALDVPAVAMDAEARLRADRAAGFAFFETAIGRCGIAWAASGVTAVRFPSHDAERAHASLARVTGTSHETAHPSAIADTVRRIVATLSAQAEDFSDVPVDLTRLDAFDRNVLAIARRIPFGRTRTYGEIAGELGDDPRLAIDVGVALGRNPVPIIVPCHRVVAANGKLGGFSGAGGVATKRKLLTIEGAVPLDAPSLFDLAPSS